MEKIIETIIEEHREGQKQLAIHEIIETLEQSERESKIESN